MNPQDSMSGSAPAPAQKSDKQNFEALDNSAKRGASWFYWIAGLSLINSIAIMMNADFVLIIGLGITQVIDGIALGIADQAAGPMPLIMGIGFLLNCAVAGGFIFLGWRARKLEAWAFTAGMVLYGLDALLFLVFADMISVGFHAFVLFMLWGGMRAAREARKLQAAGTGRFIEEQQIDKAA